MGCPVNPEKICLFEKDLFEITIDKVIPRSRVLVLLLGLFLSYPGKIKSQ